jgi:hypothetical protein
MLPYLLSSGAYQCHRPYRTSIGPAAAPTAPPPPPPPPPPDVVEHHPDLHSQQMHDVLVYTIQSLERRVDMLERMIAMQQQAHDLMWSSGSGSISMSSGVSSRFHHPPPSSSRPATGDERPERQATHPEAAPAQSGASSAPDVDAVLRDLLLDPRMAPDVRCRWTAA